MITILDNLRSIHNTASIFRTADAAGIEEIWLCGTTPKPIDKWGREVAAFTKVSLGAQATVTWKYFNTTSEAISAAKEISYEVIALEQSESSVDIYNYRPTKNLALIVGPERIGITGDVLKQCDKIIEIPMHGKKESLNVSVAYGIAVYLLNTNKYVG